MEKYKGCCNTCKFFIDEFFYNGSTDCKKVDLFTESDFENYFIDGKPDCPYYEELKEPDTCPIF